MNIAIIGAGISGSLLAQKLSVAGNKVSVFDKSRGTGGRCTHKRLAWGSFDMGAPVIPVTDSSFDAFMRQQVSLNNAQEWPSRLHQFDQKLIEQPADAKQYIFLPTMHALCKKWLADSSLVTEFKVEKLYKRAGLWYLVSDNGETSTGFDRIVLCIPWPQAHTLLSTQTEVNTPQLSQQTWTSCWAVAMQFSQPIDSTCEYIYCKDAPLQSLVNESSKPGRDHAQPIWVAYFKNSISEQLDCADKLAVQEIALNAMQQVLGVTLPKLTNGYQHYWRYARPLQQQSPLGIVGCERTGLIAGGDWSDGASIQAAYSSVQKLYRLLVN